jgi:O-antigen/teichoic acid export membrane protein
MLRRRLPDILIILALFLLPLVMFWQQTVGGRTLLPTENLYQYEPFATYREVAKAPAIPHNALLSDLVLENYQWKSFIRESIANQDIPLWNPHQFAGIPFLAAGQQSTLYPFSIIYYIMPLTAAYGWFTVVQLWLAGLFMYAFMRGLRVRRFSGLIAGIIYQLSAFFVISAVFPMIIASAAWLPLILLMAELIIQQRPALGRPSSIPWVAIGALALGCNILAGHVEITYYTLIITAYYAAFRLLWQWRNWRIHPAQRLMDTERQTPGGHVIATVVLPQSSPLRRVLMRGFWLMVMITLGIGIGAIQFIPLFELASVNYRDGRATLEQIRGWAHPLRDAVQLLLPNFYGNPSHHSYIDLFNGQTLAAPLNNQTIDWGIKNYVEGALYLGILPLLLSIYGLVDSWLRRVRKDRPESVALGAVPPYRVMFTILALISLTFMFGLPTYAILYYGFPGVNQLHSPFRWIFAVTLAVGVLAGFGADALTNKPFGAQLVERAARIKRMIAYAALASGGVILLGLFLSRIFYTQLEPSVNNLVTRLALASRAFSDGRMFYSYEFTNILILGVMLLGAGLVFILAHRDIRVRGIRLWQPAALIFIAADLMIASWGFNPASDPALLDFTPPAIQWLKQQPGQWRYTTLEDPAQRPIMNANIGWSYGLDDIRGYESIIPKQYVDYMQQLAPQVQLDYNRVAPFYTPDNYNHFGGYHRTLDSPLLDLLNVRYVITHKNTTIYFQEWKLAYEDEAVRIWENDSLVPRAYLLPENDPTITAKAEDLSTPVKPKRVPESFQPATITMGAGREQLIEVHVDKPSWLVVSQTYMPGWRAYIRPPNGDKNSEKPLDVQRVQTNFQGVRLTESGDWTIRLVYSPSSFQVGLFSTFISGILIIFSLGIWLWRLFITQGRQTSGAAVVARNSLAPIILNLFNRGIDFGFAFIMLRILGPEGSGIYYYAVFIFGWFDIFTNFGLNVFLTREVARDRSKAWPYLFNTSVLRLILIMVGIVLLLVFIFARQNAVSPPLTTEAVVAMTLLYIGLLPNSLSTGLSALFYAFQKAEYPAAITTVATISKAVFGVAALATGLGVIGLAGVSIITNFITLGVMLYSARSIMGFKRGEMQTRPDAHLIRGMVGSGWPLMLNHFLATIFFQIDVVIIQATHGDTMVGHYSVAYKWVAALNVIPAFFTMALLPIMSRQAHEDRAALKVNYGLAIKLLVMTALPIAVIFTFMAFFLTGVLGGAQYLPDGAIATQLMIWSIPIGWMNSLTQYVLIALDLQRRITQAFFIAVTFNIISNLILIPPYGYQAAAVTTIASEVALFIPFAWLLGRTLNGIHWRDLIWRPVVAALAMLAAMLVLWGIQPFIALVIGALIYLVVLFVLRPFNADELARLTPLLPTRLRKLVAQT